MQLRTAGLLFDIRTAAYYIVEDTQGATFETFLANRQLRQLVERNIIIIAEAIIRLGRRDPVTADRISEIPQIVSMRNIVVHEYETVDYERVWRTIQGSIPILLAEVDALLLEAPPL